MVRRLLHSVVVTFVTVTSFARAEGENFFDSDPRAPAASEIQFRVEYSKPEIFAGEQVVVNFVLYGIDEMLDAEVAKFPEFRGFWSENLTLRQGPLPLMADRPGSPWKKTILGAYVLTPMIGKADPTIEPMKLVVRRAIVSAGGPEIVVLSEVPKLKIKPLPAPPVAEAASFRGAVGRFSFFPEFGSPVFQKDEPMFLRFVLQGEGNFQEINDLELQLPPEVEILSRRAFSQGMGQYATKNFEFTLAIHADHDVVMPEVAFTFFNPLTVRYETVKAPSVTFRYQPAAPRPVTENEKTEPEAVDFDRTWTAHYALRTSVLFWLAQLLGLTALLGWEMRQEMRHRRRVKERSAVFQRQKRFESTLGEIESGDWGAFLKHADELAFEILARRCGETRDRLSRARAVALARTKCNDGVAARAELLFRAYERFAFAPSKETPTEKKNLVEALETLMKQAA